MLTIKLPTGNQAICVFFFRSHLCYSQNNTLSLCIYCLCSIRTFSTVHCDLQIILTTQNNLYPHLWVISHECKLISSSASSSYAPYTGQELIHTVNHCFVPNVTSNISSEVYDANCSFVLYAWVLHNIIQGSCLIKTCVFPSNISPSPKTALTGVDLPLLQWKLWFCTCIGRQGSYSFQGSYYALSFETVQWLYSPI